jgi:hypothetical protein
VKVFWSQDRVMHEGVWPNVL